MSLTLTATKLALKEAQALAETVKAHPSPAGVEAVRMAADRVLAAGSLWARSEDRPARSLAEARKVCRAASALRVTAEALRPLAALARLGSVTVGV